MSVCGSVASPFSLQLLQVTISFSQHPNRKREFEVRIRDRDRPVEHPFDRFLCPRTVLYEGMSVSSEAT
jgi:hypothetical protein